MCSQKGENPLAIDHRIKVLGQVKTYNFKEQTVPTNEYVETQVLDKNPFNLRDSLFIKQIEKEGLYPMEEKVTVNGEQHKSKH